MDDADTPDSVDHGGVACEGSGGGAAGGGERRQIDSRIGRTVPFAPRSKTRGPVRALRADVVPRDVERESPGTGAFTQVLGQREQDPGAEALAADGRIERDPEVGGHGVGGRANHQLGREPAVDEPRVRATLGRARRKKPPQRVGGGAVERREFVGRIERIGAPSPGGEGVDVAALHRTDRNDRPGGVVHWTMRLALIFATLLGVAAGWAGPAAAQSGCTVQQFAAPEAPVSATYCAGAVANGSVTVTQTYTANGKSFAKPLAIAIVAGAGTSRATDDVNLGPLGIPRTLHVHVSYAKGVARMTGGLLIPGAIPVTPADH